MDNPDIRSAESVSQDGPEVTESNEDPIEAQKKRELAKQRQEKTAQHKEIVKERERQEEIRRESEIAFQNDPTVENAEKIIGDLEKELEMLKVDEQKLGELYGDANYKVTREGDDGGSFPLGKRLEHKLAKYKQAKDRVENKTMKDRDRLIKEYVVRTDDVAKGAIKDLVKMQALDEVKARNIDLTVPYYKTTDNPLHDIEDDLEKRYNAHAKKNNGERFASRIQVTIRQEREKGKGFDAMPTGNLHVYVEAWSYVLNPNWQDNTASTVSGWGESIKGWFASDETEKPAPKKNKKKSNGGSPAWKALKEAHTHEETGGATTIFGKSGRAINKALKDIE